MCGYYKNQVNFCNQPIKRGETNGTPSLTTTTITTRGVASQKVMERQACPHETLKIIHDCKKKRLMTQWGASQHTVLYYYSLNN